MKETKEKKLSKEKEYKLQKFLMEYLDMQNEFSKLSDACVKRKKKIQEVFKKFGLKEYVLGSENEVASSKVRFTIVKRANNPTFDVDEIKKRLGKEIFNQICDKTYTVTDYKSFAKVLKKYGVNPKEILPYINVDENIKLIKMQKLYEKGELDLKELKGCYEINSTEYLQNKFLD